MSTTSACAPFRVILLTYCYHFLPWFFSISLSVGKVWLRLWNNESQNLFYTISSSSSRIPSFNENNSTGNHSLSLSLLFLIRPCEPNKRKKKWKWLNCQSLEIRFAAEGMNPIFRSALSLFFPFFPPAFDDVELFSLAFVNLSVGGEYVFWEFGRDFPALPPSKSENLQSPKIPSWMRDKHVPFSFSAVAISPLKIYAFC
jgi:hypothetical protein